ncbi:MAG: hypothetical protein AAFW73_10810 [Bacteroidota bacterium]
MKNHRYRIVIAVLALMLAGLSPNDLRAQELSPGHREIGLRLSSVNSFSLIYNRHKGGNVYRRWRFGAAGLGLSSTSGSQSFNLQASVAVGREKRRDIGKNFDFVYGLEFIGNFNLQAGNGQGNLSLNPGIGFVIGFQYYLTKAFYIGLELVPSITTNFRIDDQGLQDAFGFNAGFSSNAAALRMVYRFQKA